MFVEPKFVLLVILCWITFRAAAARFRPHVLGAWGLVFYGLYAPQATGFVAVAVAATYWLAGRRLKGVVVALLVGLLVYFKWPAGPAAAAGVTGIGAASTSVPLGFSYLALELMHFAIDRSRGRIRHASVADFAAFTLFFPCRVAGPIKRYNDFTASVAQAELSPDGIVQGCLRILSGLFKKVVLADALGRIAGTIAVAATPAQAWWAMTAYSLGLYLDFSAYSDFAIGVSRLMGIRVPENFRSPYLSLNIQDFWNRWHMSLSFWARDYVFTSVGRQLLKTGLKARPGLIATSSYMATFLAIGAWHGLTPNFLVWGAYHGLLVTAFHFYKIALPTGVVKSAFYQSRVASCASAALTFALVTIGWVFFSMDLPSAVKVVRLMLIS